MFRYNQDPLIDDYPTPLTEICSTQPRHWTKILSGTPTYYRVHIFQMEEGHETKYYYPREPVFHLAWIAANENIL